MRQTFRRLLIRLIGRTVLPVSRQWRQLTDAAYVSSLWPNHGGLNGVAGDVVCPSPEAVSLGAGVIIEGGGVVLVGTRGGHIVIGNGSWIARSVNIRGDEGAVTIGNSSFIGSNSMLLAGTGCLTVGSRVLIGPAVSIVAKNHRFDDLGRSIVEQGLVSKGIVIEDDVWVGTRACVLDGVTLGSGSIVAAGAVVTKNVAPYSIVAGVPARVVRQRKVQELKRSE